MINHHARLKILTPMGVKSIPLSGLSDSQWQVVSGVLSHGPANKILHYYQRVPWLFRGVNSIADALARVPRRYYRLDSGDEVVESDLPIRVNWPALINHLAADELLYGAAYVYILRDNLRRPTGLRRLLPTSITPEYDERDGEVAVFKRRINDRVIELEPGTELAYMWFPNRSAEVGPGTPPAAVALLAAMGLYSIDMFSHNYFEQGALDPTIVVVEDWERLSEAEQGKIKSYLERMVKGVRNAFNLVPLGTNVKVEQISRAVKDLAMVELSTSKREDIATALGVPQSLLFSNAANFAVAHQDDLHFYDKTVSALGRRMEELLDQVFAQLGLDFEFDFEALPVFQGKELERAERLNVLARDGTLTRNEVRAEMGYEPLPGQDAPSRGQGDSGDLVPLIKALLEKSRGGEPMPPAAAQGEESAFIKELRLFGDFAARRVKEGKPEKIAGFTSVIIPRPALEALKASVEGARTPAEVRQLVKTAGEWSDYYG